MKKTTLVLIAFISTFAALRGQGGAFDNIKDDINGDLILEIGHNRLLKDLPEELSQKVWGSRGINLYYMHRFKIGNSDRIFFTPGLGLGLENYSFKNNVILGRDLDADTLTYAVAADTTFIKSKLSVNYVDIPLEFRFKLGKSKKWAVSVGGKLGFLFDAHSKIKFEEAGEKKKIKAKDDFNIRRFRYGAQFRVSYGKIGVFGYYGLSDLFQPNRGPQVNPITVGISLNTF